MKSGDTRRVEASSLTLEGEGLARVEAREVLCPGLFPSEQATVRIEAVSRHHARAHAQLLTLERPHPARRLAPCVSHASRTGGCTGCALMELGEDTQRELKRAMLRDRFGLTVERVEAAPEELGYRWSSKRVAFGAAPRLTLGSYARGSHARARMDGCLVDHSRLVAAFDEVAQRANALGIRAFDEKSRHGDLRYVWAKTNGDEVIVTLVVAGESSEAVERLAPALTGLAGVLVSIQTGAGNSLRGTAPTLVCGKAELATELLGQRIEVGALGFLQPNPRVAELAYRALLGEEPSHELVFDLYAGAGVTTRALRARSREVVACESYPESARALGIEASTVEDFLDAWLAREPARVPDLVIANPPRKGMGEAACSALVRLGAPTLRIMSCGPEGLARDLAQLNAGGYTLERLRAFDTLPQTPHVELVASLRREEAALGSGL